MGLTTAGRDHICQAIIAGAVTSFATANARIGVGSSATAFAAAQTDLQAATDKLRKVMDAGYPQIVTSNTLRFRATFDTSEANFAGGWQEWAVFNAAAAGTMLNRKVQSLGTKGGTESWQVTCDLTLTAA